MLAGGATVKLTVSIKRRLGNGAEVFIAPGIELTCSPDELDNKQAEVSERVKGWVDSLVADFPDPADEEDDAEEAEDAEEADDEEGDLTAEDIDGMDKKALLALIKDNELEVDGAAKMKLDALREAVKEASGLNDEEEADEEDDEDDAEEGDEELTAEDIDGMDKKALLAMIEEHSLDVDGAAKMKLDALREAVKEAAGLNEDEEAGDDDESEGYTEDELKKMNLEELQEICSSWEIGDPAFKKGTKPDLKTKKAAYIKHILTVQDEAEED